MPLFLACYVEGVPTVLIVGTFVGVCRHFTPFFCRYFAASKQWQSEHWYIDNILFKGVCPSYSFLRYSSKKRNKRSAADCIFSAKNGSRFPKARKLASYACSNSPRFLTENAPHSLNAPKMRSELYHSYRAKRCCVWDSVLTSGAWRKSGAFLEERAAPQNLRRRCLAALPKTGAIFSGRCADGEPFFDSFLSFRDERNEWGDTAAP